MLDSGNLARMRQSIENQIHYVLVGQSVINMLAAAFAHDQVFASKYP